MVQGAPKSLRLPDEDEAAVLVWASARSMKRHAAVVALVKAGLASEGALGSPTVMVLDLAWPDDLKAELVAWAEENEITVEEAVVSLVEYAMHETGENLAEVSGPPEVENLSESERSELDRLRRELARPLVDYSKQAPVAGRAIVGDLVPMQEPRRTGKVSMSAAMKAAGISFGPVKRVPGSELKGPKTPKGRFR